MQSNSSWLQTLRIICSAIAFTNIVYFGILFVVERPSELENPVMLPAMGFVALSVAVMSVVFPSFMWKTALKSARVASHEQEDPDSPSGFRKTIRVASNPDQLMATLRAGYQTKTILGCALGESVALFGFVLGFLGLSIVMTLPFFLVSMGLILAHFPSEAKMLETAESVLEMRIIPTSR